jgi:adenylate cyclase, class 2
MHARVGFGAGRISILQYLESPDSLTRSICLSNVGWMGYEVEVKYRSVDHGLLGQRLTALGASQVGSVGQVDVYLKHPARDFATTNEAFRVRSIGEENRITYKGPRRPGPTKTREEIEIRFADGEEATRQLLDLFKLLGFVPAATIRKTRTSFLLNRAGHSLEVVLDRADGLGDFAEVETLASSEPELPAAQSAVLALAAELGLTEPEPRSYLRMALESQHSA